MALYHVIEAACIRPYSVYLKFEDGTEGVVDLDNIVGAGGVFVPLKDPMYFAQGRCDEELGTIAWPNGADLAPDVLYDLIKQAKPGHVAVLP